jgi:hypothetical protein
MRSSQPLPAPAVIDAARWAARLGAITADALALRDGVAPATAARRLAVAERADLVACSRPLRGRPALYTVTRAGLRVTAEARLDPCRVTPGNAQHLIECAAVAAALGHRHPDHRVEGERELRRAEHDAGRPLASARVGLGPDGEPRLHRPDLVLWPRADGAPVAVEVELTVKAPRRLSDLCRAWARCRLVDGVLYCVAPSVARPLGRAVAAAQAGDRIVVVALADVLAAARTVPSAP